jgi:peptidyl-prolyl cis-trans isomerase SurA
VRAVAVLGSVLVLSGCAVPRWVPFVGKSAPNAAKRPPTRETAAPLKSGGKPGTAKSAAPADREGRPTVDDDTVADRIVAVVNNDAITLGEVQQAIAGYRHEHRDSPGPSDGELARQFLTRLIETRLQLQEADRERITVEDAEVTEELKDRLKKVGAATMEEFEAQVRAQGMTMEVVRQRLREALRVDKVKLRKVRFRISVTQEEIDRYLEDNHQKLETGLAYHARHILVVPGEDTTEGWAVAQQRAEAIYAELSGGSDFAEMARRYSGDSTARDGGDLGTLKRGELAADIERHILALSPGEISRPYRSSLGLHLFKLESKEGLGGEALTRVRQQINDILFREKYEARYEAWLKEIKQRAIIEIRM